MYAFLMTSKKAKDTNFETTAMEGDRTAETNCRSIISKCISCIIITNHIRRDTNHHGSPTGNREGHQEDGRLPGEISQPHPIWCVNFCLPWKRPCDGFFGRFFYALARVPLDENCWVGYLWGGSRIDPKAPLTAPKHPLIIQGWLQWIGAYSRAVSCELPSLVIFGHG